MILRDKSTIVSTYLIIEIHPVLEHLLSAVDVEQDVTECTDGVLVTSHHHVCKPNVVIRRNLAGGHVGVHVLQKHTNLIAYVSR